MKKSVLSSAFTLAPLLFPLLSFTGCYAKVEVSDSSAEKAIAIDWVEPPCAEPGSAAGYIEGNGFGAENVTITVDGIEAVVLAATGKDASFVVPEGLTPGPVEVVVTNPGGRIATINWVVCGFDCSAIDCDDGNECTADTCDPAVEMCVHTPVGDGVACDFDGLPGVCIAGQCEEDPCASLDCDDGNQCTIDTCDPVVGQCVHAPLGHGMPCDLGVLPGGNLAQATDINDAGQVVGFSRGSFPAYNHAFLWENGVMTDLGTPDVYSEARGINNAGDIVGVSTAFSGSNSAVMWKNGALLDLGTPGDGSTATAINENSQVAGEISYPGVVSEAFIWDAGIVVGLGTFPGGTVSQARDVNDVGQIVGWGPIQPYCCQTRAAFLWDGGPLLPLESLGNPDDPDDVAYGMNNIGLIAGYSSPPSTGQRAVLWQGERLVEDLGWGKAHDVNDLAQVVGVMGDTAFFWQDGNLIDLEPLVTGLHCQAMAINEVGQVVGECKVSPVESHAVLWTVDF